MIAGLCGVAIFAAVPCLSAAAKLFEVMQLPVSDVNAQNLRMRDGENKHQDIERHVNGWIKAHQKTFDGWVAQALAAAR